MHEYLAALVGDHVQAELPDKHTEPAQNPFGTGWLKQFAVGQVPGAIGSCEIRWGVVLEGIPYCNAYRVQCGPQSLIWCSDSSHSGYVPFGSKSINTITPGSFVFILVHPQTPSYGTIIAVEPPFMGDTQLYRSDYIWPGSNCGFRVEQCHQSSVQNQTSAGGIINWSAGRPIDSTTAGEWGAITESGSGVFLDPFMAFIRGNEENGLFIFNLFDALTRLAGHNLQIRSAVGEQEEIDDENEISVMKGYALYNWENLGAFKRAIPVSKTNSVSQVQGTSQAYYAGHEPSQDDQEAYQRFQQYHGYLGQGSRRTMASIPSSGTINRYSMPISIPGLLQETIAASGAYMLQSARRIVLTKKSSVTIPKMMTRPEDKNGDSAFGSSPYNSAGGLNSGPIHLIAAEPAIGSAVTPTVNTLLVALPGKVSGAGSASAAAAFIQAVISANSVTSLNVALQRISGDITGYPTDVVPHLPSFGAAIQTLVPFFPAQMGMQDIDPPPELVRASDVLDLGAFVTDWEGLHPFFYHKKDWYLSSPQQSWKAPTYTDLANGQYLKPPSPSNVFIDHRVGTAALYPAESVIALLDDGGIVIGDGYGSEIKMTAGSIFISCPGDVWLQSGKNVNCWAGWDFIAKALNSADVTATNKDVRLKAEHDVMIVGGNDGCGGVLVESLAACPNYNFAAPGEDSCCGGVVLKAQTGQVACWGQDLILWADPVAISTAPAGMRPGIMLVESRSRIRLYCQFLERFLSGGAYDFFTDPFFSVTEVVNEYWPDALNLGSDLRVAGDGNIANCLWVGGMIIGMEHIITFLADDPTRDEPWTVGAFETPQDITEARQVTTDTLDRDTWLTTNWAVSEIDTLWRFNLANSLGNAEVTLRTSTQYKTSSNWLLMENRWQQSARLSNASLPNWTENPLSGALGQTFPYPGQTAWQSQYSFFTENCTLYDVSNGASKDRSSNQAAYETPCLPRPSHKTISSNYKIITTS